MSTGWRGHPATPTEQAKPLVWSTTDVAVAVVAESCIAGLRPAQVKCLRSGHHSQRCDGFQTLVAEAPQARKKVCSTATWEKAERAFMRLVSAEARTGAGEALRALQASNPI